MRPSPPMPGDVESMANQDRPRSRRALLAGALGGLTAAAAAAVGHVNPVRGAAGDAIRMGRTNKAGGTGTILQTNTGDPALKVLQNGGGAAIRGQSLLGDGGFFRTDADNKSGLVARNTSPTAFGGAAITAVAKANYGVYATSETHIAMRGESGIVGAQGISTTGTGVSGHSSSGIGVRGISSGNDAVQGSSSSGRGVHGLSSTGHGVRGTSTSSFGVSAQGTSGVSAIATTGWGLHASSNSGPAVVGSSTSGIGVYGNSASNWSGYFQIDARVENDFQVGGNASVAGSLSKGGGSFRIDHPLDPENKLLQHSFVESPEMLNVYSGTVTTGSRGVATIRLPDWFDALNRDVRYQLTTIGDARAWVHRKASGNRFAIKTDRANVEVCWQVTGVRRDAWAEANRIQVEMDKTTAERGTYLHPREHGKPESMGINHLERERVASGLPKIR